MALYNGRTLDEIRAAFILNRFAERSCFGRSDIESWLNTQKHAGTNPDMEIWPRLLRRSLAVDTHLEEVTLDTVLRYANPLPEPPTDGEDEIFTEWCTNIKLLYLLHRGGAKLYFGHRDVVYVVERKGRKQSVFGIYRSRSNGQNEMHIAPPIYWANFEMLLMTWKRGRKGWRKSRTMLCDHLDNTIAREKAKAIDDFNSAVAISTDGKKIISSPWVVTRGKGKNPNLLFPASAFAGNPFIRDEWMTSDSVDVHARDAKVSEGILLEILGKLPEYNDYGKGGFGKERRVSVWQIISSYPRHAQSLTEIFITSSQPPGSMPDGGTILDSALEL